MHEEILRPVADAAEEQDSGTDLARDGTALRFRILSGDISRNAVPAAMRGATTLPRSSLAMVAFRPYVDAARSRPRTSMTGT